MTMSASVLFVRRFFCGPVVIAMLLSPAFCRGQGTTDTTQAAAATTMAEQVSDLQKVVDRWDDAVEQHDQYALELVLAPQYISITDTGEVRSRDQVISEMVTKGAVRYSLEQKVVSVREVGDVAVVNGTYERSYQGSRLSRTKASDRKGVFSQVYVRARNSWECINSQRTLIVEPVGRKKKKSKEDTTAKPLHHDLGFHLPGRHHSSDDSQPK